MRIILLTVLFLVLGNQLFSQTIINGNVTIDKNQPIVGANIYLKGTIEGTTSDENGRFILKTNLLGVRIIVVSYLGYKTYEKSLNFDSKNLDLSVILSRSEIELKDVVIQVGRFEAGDAKKSATLNRLDMATSPVGFGDALGSIKTLPGISNAADEGGLLVRGGEKYETKTFIDGLLVESPYTAKLPNVPVRGRFSPMLFKGTVFSTGGYSAEFGQALSSALILNTIDFPQKNETSISVYSSGLVLTKSNNWANSSMSSTTQYNNMMPFYRIVGSAIKWKSGPQNFNQTLVFRQKIGKIGLLKIMGNYSNDQSSMYYNNIDSLRKNLISLKCNDYFVVSSYKDVVGKDWLINSGISFNFNNEKMVLNKDQIDHKKFAGEFNLKVTKRINSKINIKFGGSLFQKDFSRNYLLAVNNSIYKWKFNNQIYAAFIESELRICKRISARIGGRSETLSLSSEANISPRLSLAFVTSLNSQISLAYGQFSEQPIDNYLLYNSKLKSEKVEHYIINYQVAKNNRLFRVEGYYKNYSKLVKYDSLYAINPNAYNNQGKGYARGIDMYYRDNASIPNGDFWISYSFMDSKRNYKDYTFSQIPSFISKHNLSFVYKHYIEKADSYISVGYEYASGRPYIDPNKDIKIQLKTKSYNNLSISIFHFTQVFGKFTMIYAQCTNILGFNNVFGYNYAKQPDVSGVYNSEPIIPVTKRFFLIGVHISFAGKPEI